MIIVVTASGKDLSSSMDSRFGRAPFFIVYNTDSKTFSSVDNTKNQAAAQGAGIQAAQNVISLGANALITGHCGPKAFTVLNQSGVEIYNTDTKTVQEAIDAFANGTLKKSGSPDVRGHW